MREEYDLSQMKSRSNPYVKWLNRQVTIETEVSLIDVLTKFIAVDNSIKNSDKAQDFLKLGGSNCWSGNLEKMRENRVDSSHLSFHLL